MTVDKDISFLDFRNIFLTDFIENTRTKCFSQRAQRAQRKKIYKIKML